LEVLVKLGSAQAIEPLMKRLAGGPWERKEAAQWLAKLGHPEWAVDVSGQHADFQRLAASKNPRAFEVLTAMALSGDRQVRESAIEALGESGNARALRPLIKALSSGCKSAADALARLGKTEASDALIEALGHESEEVRQAADRALGSLGEPLWKVGRLVDALQKGSERLRGGAKESLSKMPAELVITPLIELFASDNKDIRKSAIDVASLMGRTEAMQALCAALRNPQASISTASAEALGNIGWGAGGWWTAEHLLNSLAWTPKASLAPTLEALGKFGDVRAVQPLLAFVDSTDKDLARAAAASISKIVKGPVAIPPDPASSDAITTNASAEVIEIIRHASTLPLMPQSGGGMLDLATLGREVEYLIRSIASYPGHPWVRSNCHANSIQVWGRQTAYGSHNDGWDYTITRIGFREYSITGGMEFGT